MASDGAPADKIKGEFVRAKSAFRDFVAVNSPDFPPAKNRYHLYVSHACPWAHRAIVYRAVKGLEDAITVDVVDWKFDRPAGWRFSPDKPGCTADTVNGATYVKDVYQLAQSGYEGRNSVPVLWDKEKKTIVNNESSEIIRMFNSEFNEFCATNEQRSLDLYPEHLRKEIDELNEWIYKDINNGVYRCGFATTQEAYDKAVKELFAALDRVEKILDSRRYLTGNTVTEADVRLYTTLVRFDLVYVGHFKCNIRRIIDYPNMWGYLKELYQMPGFGSTTNTMHIRCHYQQSHPNINPYGIVAAGPEIDFSTPHGRDKKFT